MVRTCPCEKPIAIDLQRQLFPRGKGQGPYADLTSGHRHRRWPNVRSTYGPSWEDSCRIWWHLDWGCNRTRPAGAGGAALFFGRVIDCVGQHCPVRYTRDGTVRIMRAKAGWTSGVPAQRRSSLCRLRGQSHWLSAVNCLQWSLAWSTCVQVNKHPSPTRVQHLIPARGWRFRPTYRVSRFHTQLFISHLV